MNYLKVKGHENLYRDSNTGAIINTEVRPKTSISKQFNNAIEDINNLKEEISEIKSLLKELIRNGNSQIRS
jgi:predicted transcriptional regulator